MSKFSDFIRNASPEEKRRVYEAAMRAATERQVMTISRAKSMAISHRGRRAILDAEEVNFDLDRMKRAVEGPFIVVPEGLTREQFCNWMAEQAAKLKQELQP